MEITKEIVIAMLQNGYIYKHDLVDQNIEAVKKAKSYLSYSSFSREELIRQLEYEGFTYEQAVYGVTQNGL